jgi:hypothetical protein
MWLLFDGISASQPVKIQLSTGFIADRFYSSLAFGNLRYYTCHHKRLG